MTRKERRQREREIRQNQKEVRRRKRDEAQAAEGGMGGLTNAEAAMQAEPAAAQAIQSSAAEAKADNAAASHDPAAQPRLLPAYTVEDVAKDAAQANTEARDNLKQSKLVSADEAAELLSFAARRLSDVIDAGHRALSRVSPQRLKEATEVVNAPAEPSRLAAKLGITSTPQQRPRRGTDPVITLMKLMVSAVSLLQRVISRLHPKLRRAA